MTISGRVFRLGGYSCAVLLAWVTLSFATAARAQRSAELRAQLPLSPVFENPLTLVDPRTGPGVSCPDPAIMEETIAGVENWYLYCTGDPLNSNDKDAQGNLRNHYIATWRSVDLIHWTYNGDVFPADPAWIGVETNLWAPAVKYFNGQYYLYYVAPQTGGPGGPSEIGVATSAHAGGPWKDLGRPVVATESAPCCTNTNRAVIDPDMVTDDKGQRYISFGSFFGGVSLQKLSRDGFTADRSSEVQIAVDNLYEGAAFYRHDGWYYLFVSSTNCCNGPLSGYSVNVGRARTPLGPFLDQNGAALTDTTGGGGSKAIAANGNKWLGPGGNVIFKDASGQDYMLYHAIDAASPYFAEYAGFTRRPALIDPIEWVNGWPTVRNGNWASAKPVPGPVAQPWQSSQRFTEPKADDEPGEEIAALSDEFNSPKLSKQWHFLHPQANNTYKLTGSAYEVATQGPDENGNPNLVEILGEPAPAGDYLVETKVTVDVPFDGTCCYNFSQGTLFLYDDDANSIKLDVFADFDTRQTEFGKQIGPVPANYPTYGSAFIGSPARTTWLRVACHRLPGSGGEQYTAYTSNDGYVWTRGSAWDHHLGAQAQIGLAAENEAGVAASFDYVRVYRLKERWVR